MTEMSTEWFKSSRSAAAGHCVECRSAGDRVQVRDSKDRQGPMLSFEADVWAAFVDACKVGEFDQ